MAELVLRLICMLSLAGCAAGGTNGSEPASRATSGPLTVQEVTERFRTRSVELGRCYERERFNQAPIERADYVASVTIPPEGSPLQVSIASAAVPGLEALEDCICQVLKAVRFRAHDGPEMTLDVPVRAPGR